MDSENRTLADIDREIMLRNMHWMVQTATRYSKHPLWVFVRDACGVGSTTAQRLCKELGWDADAKTSAHLPPYGSAPPSCPQEKKSNE